MRMIKPLDFNLITFLKRIINKYSLIPNRFLCFISFDTHLKWVIAQGWPLSNRGAATPPISIKEKRN